MKMVSVMLLTLMMTMTVVWILLTLIHLIPLNAQIPMVMGLEIMQI